jgi:4-hydroxybenzoate polyprenyltransferase
MVFHPARTSANGDAKGGFSMNLDAREPFVSEPPIQTEPETPPGARPGVAAASRCDTWRNWAELVRLPNTFTAMADPLAGALLVGIGWGSTHRVILLMLASACLYAGGIVLNDWHDFKRDCLERPERPLPSKRIGRFKALLAAGGLLGAGFMLAWVAHPVAAQVAALLVASIVSYDVLLKDVPIAPGIMGLCRGLNLLLGMSLVPAGDASLTWDARFILAAILWLYVTGITTFARREFDPKDKTLLVIGAGMSAVALFALLGVSMLARATFPYHLGLIWLILLVAVVGNRIASGLLIADARHVQQAVKFGILGIIALDAAMIGYRAGLGPSIPVILLLVPTLVLGRKLAST